MNATGSIRVHTAMRKVQSLGTQTPPANPAHPPGLLNQTTLVNALGMRREDYHGDVVRPLLQGVGALVGGILLVAAAAFLLLNGFFGGLIVTLVFLGALLVILGPLLLFQAARSFGAHLTVYDQGITLRRGRTLDVIPWDEMTYFLTYPLPQRLTAGSAATASTRTTLTRTASRMARNRGAPVSASGASAPVIRYGVVLRNGGRISLQGYQRLPEVAATIEREMGARLYPQLIAAFHAGHPIPFGPWWLHHVGVTAGSTTLPWQALADVRVADGAVLLTWQQPPQGQILGWQAPLARVPNVRLLLRLITDIRRGVL